MKAIQKEPKNKTCPLIFNLKPFRSWFKRKHSTGKDFERVAAPGKRLLTQISLKHLGIEIKKIMQSNRMASEAPKAPTRIRIGTSSACSNEYLPK